jgi:signal transduction histidine kinase
MLYEVASGSRLLPTRPVKDSHLQSSAHAGHTSAAALRSAATAFDARYADNKRGLDCTPIRGEDPAPIDTIARLTEQLDRLVGALRLYEQTRSIEVVLVPLAPLLWRIGAENAEAAADKCMELRVVETTAAVMSHPVLLDGILRNLVRNAVKYTEPGGRILIGCRRSGETVRSMSTTPASAWRRSSCPASSGPSTALTPREATAWGSACSWYAGRLGCWAIVSRSARQ